MNYTFKLTQPITIGDITNSIVVDQLDLHSISLAFDPQAPVLSAVLEHKASGWKHVVTYVDPTVVQFWANGTQVAHFDAIVAGLVQKLVTDGKLPAGRLS